MTSSLTYLAMIVFLASSKLPSFGQWLGNYRLWMWVPLTIPHLFTNARSCNGNINLKLDLLNNYPDPKKYIGNKQSHVLNAAFNLGLDLSDCESLWRLSFMGSSSLPLSLFFFFNALKCIWIYSRRSYTHVIVVLYHYPVIHCHTTGKWIVQSEWF